MNSYPIQERELTLHYIERIHETMLATGTSINRAYLLQCVCSAITILLSFGIAKSDNQLSLAGLEIHVPVWMIVLGFSVIVAALFSYLVGLSNHLRRLRRIIVKLYFDIGYPNPYSNKAIAHPLEYPDISSVITDIGEGLEGRFVRILTGLAKVPILIITLLLFGSGAILSCSISDTIVRLDMVKHGLYHTYCFQHTH